MTEPDSSTDAARPGEGLPQGLSLPQPLGLFPLQTVLFPGGTMALRVFEARYLDLVSRCLRQPEPFGVIGLSEGPEAGGHDKQVQLEEVGTLARIDEVDSEQPGILRIRCRGLQRFRLDEPPVQRDNGLWVARVTLIADDPPRPPGPATRASVEMLEQAITVLREQQLMPFAEPLRMDDAGWVANRWCELLPMPREAKQRLMALDDPVIRLSLVDAWLRDKKIVVG